MEEVEKLALLLAMAKQMFWHELFIFFMSNFMDVSGLSINILCVFS